MCLANLTKAETSAGANAVISSEPFWRIWGLLGEARLGAFSGFRAESPCAPLHVFMLCVTGPLSSVCVTLSSAQYSSSSSLSSISLQQITACLQPPGCSPQLFWLRLQIYLYYTMQRAGISDGALHVQWVYIPQPDCLSSSLVGCNRCQTESGSASMSLFH